MSKQTTRYFEYNGEARIFSNRTNHIMEKMTITCLGSSFEKPGEDFYYAFRKVPEEQRRYLHQLYRLIQTWDQMAQEKENEATHPKMDWWRQEIKRLFLGNPQHQLTQMIQKNTLRVHLHREYLEEIYDGITTLHNRGKEPILLQEILYQQIGGYLFTLISSILGIETHSDLAYANKQGILCQRIHFLRSYGYWKARHVCFLSKKQKNTGFLEKNTTHSFFSDELDLIRDEIQDIQKKNKQLACIVPRAPAQKPIRCLSALFQRFLDKIEKNPEIIKKKSVRLTPIEELWSVLTQK